MVPPAFAAVIGKVEAGARGPEIFHEIAASHGLTCLPERAVNEPFKLLARDMLKRLDASPGLGAAKAVFLVCMNRNDTQHALEIIEYLTDRRAHASIVVYADEGQDSGVLAMNCVKAHHGVGVSGYLVHTRSSDTVIRELCNRLCCGFPAYPRFKQTRLRRGASQPKALIVTPYHELALTDCYKGIEPALVALDIKPVIARDEVTFAAIPILQNVQQLINKSDFVVVNLTQYKTSEPNANCYFELGYAIGRKVPVVLIHRADTGGVASNLSGVQLVEYESPADLCMRLYVGLK